MEQLIWRPWSTMWRWRLPPKGVPGPEVTRDPLALATECEHFLAGTYVDYLEALGRPVPLWARLNAVAHADVATLAGLATSLVRQPEHAALGVWETASAQMADALLRAAAFNDATPREVQQMVLVPLEARLARQAPRRGGRGGGIGRGGRDARELVAIVEAFLPPRSGGEIGRRDRC